MPNGTSTRIPSYRRHKPSGQAVVTLDGKDRYLGRHGSAASRAEYDRLIAEWTAQGRRLPDSETGMTIGELILAYWRRCQGHYRKPDGSNTSELHLVRLAMRPLKELYGRTPAAEFGPLALEAVQQRMIEAGLSRGVINAHVGRIKRMFRWAVAKELVPPAVYQGVLAVAGLQRGRTEARETEPVKPVADALVDATLPHVSPPVRAMIELQRLTGMRPGEACLIRGCDLDTTGSVWTFRPESHKTAHHGHRREIYLGPKAREVIRPWLKPETTAYLFSPRDAEAHRRALMRQERKTPVQPSQKNRRRRKPRKQPGERFTTSSFGHAVRNACKKAGLPSWHVNQLRHLAATNLRKEFGVELARIILGHATAFTTEIYAEADRQQAMEVMSRVG